MKETQMLQIILLIIWFSLEKWFLKKSFTSSWPIEEVLQDILSHRFDSAGGSQTIKGTCQIEFDWLLNTWAIHGLLFFKKFNGMMEKGYKWSLTWIEMQFWIQVI